MYAETLQVSFAPLRLTYIHNFTLKKEMKPYFSNLTQSQNVQAKRFDAETSNSFCHLQDLSG